VQVLPERPREGRHHVHPAGQLRQQVTASGSGEARVVVMREATEMIDVWQERRSARNAAWYAKTGLRRRLEQQPIQVEDRNARQRREAEERAMREAEAAHEAEADRAAELTEARRHELSVARSWGRAAAEANSVVDADVLTAISNALTGLLNRVEALEQKVEALNGTTSAAAGRIDALSGKMKSGSDRSGRQIAVCERKLEDQKDFTADLRTEVRVLRAQVNALSKQSQEPRETHVIHHGIP
jgi:chromosome segregation ATPase